MGSQRVGHGLSDFHFHRKGGPEAIQEFKEVKWKNQIYSLKRQLRRSRKARHPYSLPTTNKEVRVITAYISTQQDFYNVYVKTLDPHILG